MDVRGKLKMFGRVPVGNTVPRRPLGNPGQNRIPLLRLSADMPSVFSVYLNDGNWLPADSTTLFYEATWIIDNCRVQENLLPGVFHNIVAQTLEIVAVNTSVVKDWTGAYGYGTENPGCLPGYTTV